MKPAMASTDDVTKCQDSVMFSPYFHINSTASIDEATMHYTEVTVNGITLPCMVNPVPLKKYDELQHFALCPREGSLVECIYCAKAPSKDCGRSQG